MSSFKKLGVLVAILALSAIGAANASAATFTESATGTLTGKSLNAQVFATNSGQVKCTAHISGSIVSTATTEQHVTVEYKGCTAFGFASVDVSPATYLVIANGTVHVRNTVTNNVTLAGCHQTVEPQGPLGTITYTNLAGGKLGVDANVTGIAYKGTGSLCGDATTKTNGTYTGNSEVERVGGGSLSVS